MDTRISEIQFIYLKILIVCSIKLTNILKILLPNRITEYFLSKYFKLSELPERTELPK